MNFIHYLLQVNLYLLLFYGFYRLVLRNETFHHLNRAYLVGSATMAFFIPVLQSDWLRNSFVSQRVSEKIYTYYNPETIIVTAVRPHEPMFTWGHLCAVLYIMGIIFFLGKLALQVAHLQRFLNPKRTAKHEAFAFFNFWRVSLELAHRDTIIAHEKTHVKQLHSADVLLFELIAIFNWFNPIVYAYKQSIKNTHEFLADQVASRHHGNLADYAMLLFNQQFGVQKLELTHQFFDKITLKRRIAMLSKPKSTQKALMKYGLIAPLFGAMLIISSSAISESKSITKIKDVVDSEKPIFEGKTDTPNKLFTSTTLAEIVVMGYGTGTAQAPIQKVAEFASPRPKEGTYNVADVLPSYEEGAVAFYRAVAKTIKYPAAARRANVGGKTYTTFIVRKDGSVGDIETLRGIGFGCDEAVRKAIAQSTKWTAGQINGQNVDVQFTLPVVFGLENNQQTPKVDSVVRLTEIQAVFDGVKNKMPAAAQRANVSGVVFLLFDEDKTGEVDNVQILKGLGFGLDEEAIRIVKEMPKVNPSVKTRYSIPVRFIALNTQSKIDTLDKEEVFNVVEQQPEFKGGTGAMYKYINNHIKYPSAAVRANVTGKVFAMFVVDKTGKIKDIEIMKGIGFGCDDEAIRVISEMPAWTPGRQGKTPVNVKYTLPINFDFKQQEYKNGKVVGDQNRVTLPGPPPPPAPPVGSNIKYAPNPPKAPKSPKTPPVPPTDEIFSVVEQQPEFIGGVKEMYAFLSKNIKYPKDAQRNNITGQVFLSMTIDKTGKIKDIKVMKGIGYGCEEEAMRVVATMPLWIPGKQDNQPVNVQYTMPVNFTLE